MKKILFLTFLFFGMAGAAEAQVVQKDTAHTMHNKSTNHNGNKKNKKVVSALDTVKSNRIIYKSPRTRQKATPTGQDATGSNSSHAPNPKNASKGE